MESMVIKLASQPALTENKKRGRKVARWSYNVEDRRGEEIRTKAEVELRE